MPDISQTPVTVEEFMHPKRETPTNNSTQEGEFSYPNYYTMLSNITNVPMTNAMNPFNQASINLSNGNAEGDSKDQENVPPNQTGNYNDISMDFVKIIVLLIAIVQIINSSVVCLSLGHLHK